MTVALSLGVRREKQGLALTFQQRGHSACGECREGVVRSKQLPAWGACDIQTLGRPRSWQQEGRGKKTRPRKDASYMFAHIQVNIPHDTRLLVHDRRRVCFRGKDRAPVVWSRADACAPLVSGVTRVARDCRGFGHPAAVGPDAGPVLWSGEAVL